MQLKKYETGRTDMNGNREVKTVFVGIGGYGAAVLGNLLDRGGDGVVRIVGAADPYAHSSPCAPRLEKAGVPIYGDMEEMLGELCDGADAPELAVISTPIQFHRRQIEAALSRGINLICEKPLSGDISDIAPIEEAVAESGRFAAIGYQWSFSDAVCRLKKDILSGVFGRAVNMKTMVLWPRDKKYFTRSTRWAGKLRASDGTQILDSIANNATAHYIHNILYLLGDAPDSSARPVRVNATLLRTNDIETFDSVTADFELDNGAKGFYVASHATDENIDPVFEYIFEKGRVIYPDAEHRIRAIMDDGSEKVYGDPFAGGASEKVIKCARAIIDGSKDIPCPVSAAAEQVRFISMLHSYNRIYDTSESAVVDTSERMYVKGLSQALKECYKEEKLLSQTDYFDGIVRKVEENADV